MISTLVELEESTAFERWALEGLVPLQTTRPHISVRDIDKNVVGVGVESAVVTVHAGGVREVHVDLRPLAFGAAWKVLDLLLEYSFSSAGISAGSGNMTIRTKVGHARQSAGRCPPLSNDPALWRVLTALYAETEEIRHSLVHRTAEVDQSTGRLTGRDRAGQPLAPITAEQQEAFCRAVQRAAQDALTQNLTARERADLAWNLDQLSLLHHSGLLGGQEMGPAPLGVAATKMSQGRLLVDVPFLLGELRKNFAGRTAYDATFALQDGRHVLVELEQAPSKEVAVDLADLPSWMQFWEGSS
jgi:hypothetical protein